ncbi:MAG TPA: YjgN family protein [Candidatus Binatia bacterium]|jgi:uncharacterized membrane protein YjgN (DUF898 family)
MATRSIAGWAVAEEIPPEQQESRRLYFQGRAGTLLGIQLVNIFLILCTLGVYLFWAKVKVRRYLWSQTEFEGDRLAYHGTGPELLTGSFKAMIVFGLPFFALKYLPEFLKATVPVKLGSTALAYLVLGVFIPFAIVGSRRYRLSRTSWRSIRFSFRGTLREFFWLYYKGFILSFITFRFYSPFFELKKYEFLTNHSYFGNRKFHFDGAGRELFRIFLRCILPVILTLGIYGFWYKAKKQRYLFEHTSFDSARFTCTVTGGGLCRLTLVNLLAIIGTLGFAIPWTTVRTFRYWYDHIELEGALDLAAIAQEAQSASATAEGLAGFLDLDFGFGF